MTNKKDEDDLSWRNAAVQWHLNQTVPLECGCDDDIPDDALCQRSVDYAHGLCAARPDSALAGDPDPWNLEMWVAAWGCNIPLLASPADFRLPMPPAGMAWLVERLLVGGRKVVELVLLRTDEKDATTVLGRRRVLPEPEAVIQHAKGMLQQIGL